MTFPSLFCAFKSSLFILYLTRWWEEWIFGWNVHDSSQTCDSDAWVVIFGCISKMSSTYKVCLLILCGVQAPSQTEKEMAQNAHWFHLQIIPEHKAGDGSLFLPGFINHRKITFV